MQAEHQEYWDFPDAKLVKYVQPLSAGIRLHAKRYRLHHYFTLGETGFDGNPDHIATHYAALEAQARLAEVGHFITIWALAAPGQSCDLVVPACSTPKLKALAHHQTQMPLQRDPHGVLHVTDMAHWSTFVRTHREVLFEKERYQIITVRRQLGAIALDL